MPWCPGNSLLTFRFGGFQGSFYTSLLSKYRFSVQVCVLSAVIKEIYSGTEHSNSFHGIIAWLKIIAGTWGYRNPTDSDICYFLGYRFFMGKNRVTLRGVGWLTQGLRSLNVMSQIVSNVIQKDSNAFSTAKHSKTWTNPWGHQDSQP